MLRIGFSPCFDKREGCANAQGDLSAILLFQEEYCFRSVFLLELQVEGGKISAGCFGRGGSACSETKVDDLAMRALSRSSNERPS
jgi:hypothetical protein